MMEDRGNGGNNNFFLKKSLDGEKNTCWKMNGNMRNCCKVARETTIQPRALGLKDPPLGPNGSLWAPNERMKRLVESLRSLIGHF